MTAVRAGVRESSLLVAGCAGLAAFTTLACLRIGPAGLFLPALAAAAVLLLRRPGVALIVFVSLTVLLENRDSGLLPVQAVFYEPLRGGATPQELLFAFVLLAVALDLLAHGRPLRLPKGLSLPLALVALAVVAGAVTGYFAGAGVGDIVFAARNLPYLVLVPLLVVNLVRTRRDVVTVLAVTVGLGIAKALVGLLTVASGRGTTVDGTSITYYEPAANWLMMLLVLGVLAMVLLKLRPPLWLLAGTLMMLLSLALSFRRSFWIGLAIAMVLVLVLGSSPLGRRLLMPSLLVVAVGFWAVGSVGFQAQAPLLDRAASLKPSKIEANAEDRYRFDERANVLAELRRHPVTGLGLAVPWTSAARPLGVEHEGGRDYVHSVALYWWLKLGALGIVAYLALMLAAGWLSARVWRRHPMPLMRAVGLASLAGLIGLAVVETTGSFTGVDLRFTVLMGVLLGLLARLGRDADEARANPAAPPAPAR
jgi:O-antigen ligase